VEEDLEAAPLGLQSAWETVEHLGDGTTLSLGDSSVNSKKGMGGSIYRGGGFMACAARVLSLSRVKIGEEDRVHCRLMVISVSVGLGDKIPVAWLGCSKRSFGLRRLGPTNLRMKSFGRRRQGPAIHV
jgi:hypothetical protein